MKKIIAILLIAALLLAFPVTAAKNTDDTGNGGAGANQAAGLTNNTATEIDEELKGAGQSAGAVISQAEKGEPAGQGAGVSAAVTSANQNQQEIKSQIKLMQKEAANISGLESNNRLKNQNTVRVAVQTLLAAGNISGGIGEQISAVAKEFNNSVMSQYNAEEKIQSRNAISRFFFGGDSNAAKDIQAHIEQNRQRIENLNTLMNQCDCDEELKAMIREQIQVLEQEQNRLSELSQTELGDKGLLGGIFG
ncbi:MAG: hypothetical protein JXQ82_02990 [Methanomicrobiaceae archaeon]|nr:hypothetical protein [Methanomicrobiaceae archaeon]